MRCLVADRSATTRGIVANALRRAGATDVVAVDSLDNALAACDPPFELAIIDRDLGATPDWAWLGALREKACAEGRLVVIGTRVMRAEVEALREAGAHAFVLKPLQPEALAERLRDLLAAPTEEEVGPAEDESGEEPLAEAA